MTGDELFEEALAVALNGLNEHDSYTLRCIWTGWRGVFLAFDPAPISVALIVKSARGVATQFPPQKKIADRWLAVAEFFETYMEFNDIVGNQDVG